jgi:hypothetical protein
MIRNLAVHFRRLTYLIVPSAQTLALAGRRVLVHEWADRRVAIRCEGRKKMTRWGRSLSTG